MSFLNSLGHYHQHNLFTHIICVRLKRQQMKELEIDMNLLWFFSVLMRTLAYFPGALYQKQWHAYLGERCQSDA